MVKQVVHYLIQNYCTFGEIAIVTIMNKKISSIPKGVKASIALFFASLVTKGIAYVTTPIFTRLLTEEQYGQTSLFLSWLQILGIIAMFGLSYGVFNNGMLDYPDDRNVYAFSLLILSNIITILFSILYLGFFPVLNKWIKIDFQFAFLMSIIFLLQPAYNFWISKQRYEIKYKNSFIWSIVTVFLSSFVAVICILLVDDDFKLYARIYGAEIPLIGIYIGFYFYLAKIAGFKIKTKYWKEAITFNLPLLPHYLSIYLLSSSDKLMISFILGDAEVAYYSVAYSVAAVLTAIWSAINASLIPYTYEKCKQNNYKRIAIVTQPLLTFYALMCILLIMLAPEILALMAPKSYMNAIYVIPPIVGGVFFQVQYHVYGNIVFYHKKPKYIMFASVTATIMNLILNYIFITKYGYIAAGYTTLVCYLIQAMIDFFAMRKVTKQNVYNMKYICILSVSIILISLLSIFIYDKFFVRYLIVIVLLIMCYLFRKKFLNLIPELKYKK
ncbi:hypothetical protein SDC9_16524 [bioreactor metagenome]|uniref:Uncharacterized protein n=1 Tax=bioreactor metagenome TaxID=1076179 RepID=A0A644TUW1_9ZZZZ